jgi:hypothetical protein
MHQEVPPEYLMFEAGIPFEGEAIKEVKIKIKN